MKRYVIPVLACLFLASCSSPEEESVDLMGEFVDVLEGIKDKDSAQAAKDELKGLIEEMKTLKDEVDMEKVSEDLKAEMKEIEQRFRKEITRIMSNPELRAVLDEIAREMGKIR